MPIKVDFVVAVGIFVIVIGISLSFVLSYLVKSSQFTQLENLKTISKNIFFYLKSNLTTKLYKLPVRIVEISGDEKLDEIVNFTVIFDENCEKKAWLSSVRVYEKDKETEFSIYNQTFCEENYLKKADIVLRTNFSAFQEKIFFVYFSGEKEIKEVSYNIPFQTASGLKVEVFPLQELEMLSISKLKELRNISYDELVKILAHNFYLEVSEK
ncbi:MAG: hypothetical protein NZ942_02675 [Candidatus Aenigmarchaeota archaeon]|nr:hypothetical protein [Candidatus Aenigmarchaeota archaeon]